MYDGKFSHLFTSTETPKTILATEIELTNWQTIVNCLQCNAYEKHTKS